MLKFKTKEGLCTPYALACGYIDQYETDTLRVQLYKEHGTLHVRGFDFENHVRLFWHCPETLSEARKLYKQAVRGLKAKA